MRVARAAEEAEARIALGHMLAAYRKAAGLTQVKLAARLVSENGNFFGRSSIANAEVGRQRIGREFWVACDAALNTGDALTAEYDRLQRAINARRIDSVAGSAVQAPEDIRFLSPIRWGDAPERALSASSSAGQSTPQQDERVLLTPPGYALAGTRIPAQLHPAALGSWAATAVPAGYAADPFLQRLGRGLVVGQVDDIAAGLFVMDSRHARGRLRGAEPDARLLIPLAYRLDELAFALLWAVTNFDEALLADDAVIESGLNDLREFAALEKSAASRDLVSDANPVSQMWLGSQFCADHIRRHLSKLTDQPVFWTREQRGEQAASWLFFAHKNAYLRETSSRAHDLAALVRAFCVPESAVAESAIGERMLLLLALALMESYDIRTVVTDIPELASVPGFVADRRRKAITATWLGADGIWYTDITDNRGTLAEYDDAAGHAINHSITTGGTPQVRLRRFAEYLQLPWQPFAERCTELGAAGAAGLAPPRSRLLSLDGFDRACRYLGSVAQLDD